MKRNQTRAISLLIVLALVVSLFAGMLTVSAASYPTYNNGTFGKVCTSLSSFAKAYYTGNYTYETLSAQTGSTLKSSINTLVTRNRHTGSYDGLKTGFAKTDAVNGSKTTLRLFYCGVSASSKWEGDKNFNREHMWPDSKGGSAAEGDLHSMRPTDKNVNSTRGNYPYGKVSGGKAAMAADNHGNAVGGHFGGGYFEPLDNVKGDVARTILYDYCTYSTLSSLGLVIQNKSLLLDWMELDPVDDFEMSRNDVIEGIQGCRNPFVDYPELAYRVLNQEIPTGLVTPSNPSGSVNPTTPTTPTEPTEPTEPPKGDAYVLTNSLKNGDKVIIYNPEFNVAMSEDDATGYRAGAEIEASNKKLITSDSKIVWDVVATADGFSFKNDAGETLSCAAKLGFAATDNVWAIKPAATADCVYIESTTSKGDKGDAKMLEWYASMNDFSTYYYKSDNESYYAMQLYVLSGGVTPTTPTEPTEPTEPPKPTEPTGPSKPSEPIEPSKPTEPTEPSKPSEPIEPSKPSESCQHSYKETKVAATCSMPGYTLYTCSKCGDTYRSNFTTILNHSFKNGICTACGAKDPNYAKPDKPTEDASKLYASFNDLEKGAWYQEGVLFALRRELMKGIADNTFDPNGNITRAMVVTILYRAAGEPDAKGLKLPFIDVETGSWYTNAVAWAAENGIVKGVDEEHFKPHDNVTREQLAAILHRYAVSPAAKGNLASYIDAKDVSEYAVEPMKWAIGEGIITGIDNRLAPQETATRAQIATMFFRFLDPVAAKVDFSEA